MKWKEQWWSKALVTTKQVTVCPPESYNGLYLSLGGRLSASGLDLVNYTLKSFQYITEARLFAFAYLYCGSLDCLLVISLDNLNLNIKSHWQQLCVKSKKRKKIKKNKICIFSFHYRSVCSWKKYVPVKFSTSRWGCNAVVISEPGWQIHVSV